MYNDTATKNDKKIKSLSEVRTIKDLISFLDIETEDDCDFYYHHFTTFSKLEKILESEEWRFTPDSTKNDLHEYQVKESSEKRDKILSVSLMRGDEDNMAMWAMYAIPWEDAVRITFTKEAVLKWKEIVTNYTRRTCGIDCSIKFHNIVYYQGFQDNNKNNSLLFDDQIKEKIDNEIFYEIQIPNELSSYIKNSAWKQEQESRLSIFFKEDYNSSLDIPFGNDFSFILKNMIITFGPWTNKDMIISKKQKILDILSKKGIEIPHGYVEKLDLKEYLNIKKSTLPYNFVANETNNYSREITPGTGLLFSQSPFVKKLDLRRHCDVCPMEHATQIVHRFDGKDSFWIK